MEINCKKIITCTAIYQGGHRRQCSRKAIKDGFCGQHHPDNVKKREAHRAKKLAVTPFSFLTRPKKLTRY